MQLNYFAGLRVKWSQWNYTPIDIEPISVVESSESVNLAVSHAPLQASATSAFLFLGASRIRPSSPHEGGSLLLSPTHLREARRICVAVSAGLPRARPGLVRRDRQGRPFRL